MPPPVPALRLNLPPRPGDGTSRARREGSRGDAAETSRDRNVPRDDGSWETSSADTDPSFDFAPVFDGPERFERVEAGPPRDDAPRASRDDSGGSETASERSDAEPPDPALLRAMRRPRLAASSVAAFLGQRDDLRAAAWETAREAGTLDDRADEPNETKRSDDRAESRAPVSAELDHSAVGSVGSPQIVLTRKENKTGALPAALLEEGPSSIRGRGAVRGRGASWSALASSRDALLGTTRASRVAATWSGVAAAADASAPDESDFVASAAVGNARRTEAAAELMTPTLGDAFLEEDDEAMNEKKKKKREEEEKERRRLEEATERDEKARKSARDDPRDLSKRLVVAEVTSFYARKKAEALRRTGLVPARNRHPRETWNGGAPGLCRLAAPATYASPVSENAATRASATECFLSRTYTEGFGAPVAFAAYPSADVLCRACGDVAWDPVRFPANAAERRETLQADASNLWCRDCLLADGAAGEQGLDAEALPVDENVAARVALKRVLCRHALVCERVRDDDTGASNGFSRDEDGAEDERDEDGAAGKKSKTKTKNVFSEIRWRMDHPGHGCPDSGRLCDREQTERDCSRAVRVCGLPGDANPGDSCVARVRAGDFEAHAASECAFRLVPCSRREKGCAHAVRFKHAEQHFRLCEYRPFACPNRPRCAWRGVRKQVEAHLRKECAWEVVACGLTDDHPDGEIARAQTSRDASTGADGRAYTFGGDFPDSDDERMSRKSLRSASKRNGLGLGLLGHSARSLRGAAGLSRAAGLSSASSSAVSSGSMSSASRRARVERKLERRDRSERCEVRLVRCKLNAHRAVCRFQRAICRHCGAPRALRRLAQHEAECAFSRFACLLCGAEGIPNDSRRTHDARVCPEREMTCEFARYGCSRPRMPRREYAEHIRERMHEHLELLTRRDRKKALPERTGDGEPYPAPSLLERASDDEEVLIGVEATLGVSKRREPTDGFMALVTRHEVTRRDARRVASVASAAADGADEETRSLLASLGDAADAATRARELLFCQIARAKDRFTTQCAELTETFENDERAIEKSATSCLAASATSRREAKETLAASDALDDVARRVAHETSALVIASSDGARKLGSSLVSLLAAAAPALDAQAEMEARAAEAGAAAHARVADLEWASADEAIVAWEKIGDARESFAAKLVPREMEHRALLLKVEAFERGRYVTAGEDQAMTRKAKAEAAGSANQKKPGPEYRGEDDDDAPTGAADAPPAPATPQGAGAETARAEE